MNVAVAAICGLDEPGTGLPSLSKGNEALRGIGRRILVLRMRRRTFVIITHRQIMGGWNKGKGKAIAWLREHVNYRQNDCLKWPMARDDHGYGFLGYEGKMAKAHRVMCELVYGPPPTPQHEAAHSCGRGHQGCINPRHLSWKTRSENQRDRRKHGTEGNGSKGAARYKLTEADVAEIRTLFGVTTNREIAKRYDVTPGLISKIRNGHLWAREDRRRFIPLTDDQVREIRGLFGKKSMREIAEMYGVPEGKIQHIKYGGAHAYVP